MIPSVSFTVMAHPLRQHLALRLVDEVAPFVSRARDFVSVSFDQGEGEARNGFMCWQMGLQMYETDWHIVLQDDAMLEPWSVEQMVKALEHAPSPVVSFYTGTGRPRQRAVQAAFQRADRDHLAWLQCETLLWGVAVAIRREHIGSVLSAARLYASGSGGEGYDALMGFGARARGHKVSYTWPSLVDHMDGPSVMTHPWGPPRSPRIAYRMGQRDDWATEASAI